MRQHKQEKSPPKVRLGSWDEAQRYLRHFADVHKLRIELTEDVDFTRHKTRRIMYLALKLSGTQTLVASTEGHYFPDMTQAVIGEAQRTLKSLGKL